MACSALTDSCAGHYPLPPCLQKSPAKRLFHDPDLSSDVIPQPFKVNDPASSEDWTCERSLKDASSTENGDGKKDVKSKPDRPSKDVCSRKNGDCQKYIKTNTEHFSKDAGSKMIGDSKIVETFSKDADNKKIGDSRMVETRPNLGSRKERNSVQCNRHALGWKDTAVCQNSYTDKTDMEGPANAGRKKKTAGRYRVNKSKHYRRRGWKGKAAQKVAEENGKLGDHSTAHRAWMWVGHPQISPVVSVGTSKPTELRQCYQAIQHIDSGQVIRVRDCVLVRSGDGDTDQPYLAKVAAFWQHSSSKEMMMSVLWYYHPAEALSEIAQDSPGTLPLQTYDDHELYASRHRDECNVACIEGKGHVLTLDEFCRYKAEQRRQQQNAPPPPPLVPALPTEVKRSRKEMPDYSVSPGAVFFCRQAYDIHKKKLMKPVKPNRYTYARPATKTFFGSKNVYKRPDSAKV